MAKKIDQTASSDKGEIILYRSPDGKAALDVRLEQETVWLNQRQMAELFDKDTDTIGLHVRNIYKEGELTRKGTTEQSSVVQNEGGRQVRRKVNFYNLDVIISVGYRVKSRRGTQFRIWATNVLREHLIRGFTLNEKRLREQEQKLVDLRRTVGLLEQTLAHQAIGLDEAKGLLQVITDYAYALTTLDRFDHGTLTIEEVTRPAPYIMTYEAAMEIVKAMGTEFGFRIIGSSLILDNLLILRVSVIQNKGKGHATINRNVRRLHKTLHKAHSHPLYSLGVSGHRVCRRNVRARVPTRVVVFCERRIRALG